jgi:hypothetical protein
MNRDPQHLLRNLDEASIRCCHSETRHIVIMIREWIMNPPVPK